VFLKKKNTAAAIADYTEALGINSLKTYYVGRANAYQAGDDLDKAIADQNIVVTMSPGAGDYLRLGQLYVANNDGAGADLAFTNGLDLATKAVTANGNYASNFATRGDIYHAMKKDDLALADYNEAITRASSNAGYYEARAAIEDALGNTDAAAADRSKAAEIREASAEPAADTSSTDDAEDDEGDDSTEAPAKGSGSMRSIH
jgi:tetratricopeptide (TPR) repeat protein